MMKQKTVTIFKSIQGYWQEYWLFRWVIANFVGWGIGLFVAAIVIWIMGIWGIILSGAVIGLGIATPQAWILFGADEIPARRKWILYTTIGGFLAIFPTAIFIFLSLFNIWIAALLVGMMFSGIIALMQSFVLVSVLDERAYLWIAICIFAGAIAAFLTVPILLWTAIPLLCSPASLIFALLTGWLLLRWMHEA